MARVSPVTELEQTIIDECAQHGGPTDICLKIYNTPHTSTAGISRRRYWAAVETGSNLYRWRQVKSAGKDCGSSGAGLEAAAHQ